MKLNEIQSNIFRAMSPEKKLHLSLQLYYSSRELKRAVLKQAHPEWTNEEINQTIKEIYLYART